MKTLQLALIQPDIVWQNPIANQQQFESILAQLPKNTNLIVLPEMWATGFTMTPHEVAESMHHTSVEWMKKMAQTYNARHVLHFYSISSRSSFGLMCCMAFIVLGLMD